MNKMLIASLSWLFAIAELTVGAEYTATELFSVDWGMAEEELMIEERVINDPGTPDDSTDDYVEPSIGPSIGLVDRLENIIFSSYSFNTLKGFDATGELIFSLSSGQSDIETLMSTATYDRIICDSISNIYIVASPGLHFVPVIDFSGQIVDSLFPFGNSPSNKIVDISIDPSGSICFMEKNLGIVSYSSGVYTPGGSCGFRASDGSYYSAKALDPHTINFNKYEDPDMMGSPRKGSLQKFNFLKIQYIRHRY